MRTSLLDQLEGIGRRLLWWRAQLKLTWGLAILIGSIFVLGIIDLWVWLDRSNRMAAWCGLIAIAVGTLWLIRRVLSHRFTPEGVAATIEKTFPELDNRLINFLQLAQSTERDPFKDAYVREGVPAWKTLNFEKMRDRDAHRRSRIALGVAVVALCLPVLFFGDAWGVAVWRTVNPFTHLEPASLTKIIAVAPGTNTAMQGGPVELSCTVRGFAGHDVRVEIVPNDGPKSTFALGKIKGAGIETFTHTLAKVTTGFRYRFHAGDAPNSNWFTVTTRPPPAFTRIELVVAPPAYTGRPNILLNGRQGRIVAPAGSELRIAATANSALQNVFVVGGGTSAQFTPGKLPNVWTGRVILNSGSAVRFHASDHFGVSLDEELPYSIEPDKAPGIEVLSPGGRASLPPGDRPQIEFRVADDYGLSEVLIEEIQPDASKETRGTPLKSWKLSGTTFQKTWRSETAPARGRDVAYRIVARDNRPDRPNETVSSPILFTVPSAGDVARERNHLEQAALANLQRVLDLQKKNIADTETQQRVIDDTTAAQWNDTASRQEQIRKITRDLLVNPLKPLGNLTAAAQKTYANEMVLAIDALKSLTTAESGRKPTLAREALTLEQRILQQLSYAMDAAGKAQVDRRVAGISAMIESLIHDQNTALEQTRSFVQSQAKIGRPLVDLQDRVGENMGDFLNAAKSEAGDIAQNDAALAATLNGISTKATELKIRDDMVIAAERLDQNKGTEAVPLETRALAGLKTLQQMLDQIKLKEEAEKRDLLVDAVKQAQDKLAKIAELQKKAAEAMEQVRGQKNKDTKATDEMEEEYKEMIKNTVAAALEVPKDLHIFSELNVANDLVEDVFSVFQEIEQKAGSESDGTEAVKEMGFVKEDELLAGMGEAQERLDAVETWLGEKPDEVKVTTEAVDKAEMPESGVALAELAAAAQDLMSDLLNENEKMAKDADDSATNHAMPDFPSGWEVMEGDISSFGAQGKSGNQRPDHKEQDGRSNVGRQGMSTGETASGSGTIGEGDKNIEARRTEDPTQSGQVDLKGQADTKATGGGKLATGKASDLGMSGGAERIDSKEAGSWEGMAALMAKKADAIYANASLKNVRVDSLKDAAHMLRQSGDAVAKGNIEQMREFRKMAASTLSRAEAQLEAGLSGAMDAKAVLGPLDHVVESGPDLAPPQYRDKVAEYYKALNGAF